MAERAAKQLELNKSDLPNSITEVIATLTRAGFDAYIVGGGVRDTLLGKSDLFSSNCLAARSAMHLLLAGIL